MEGHCFDPGILREYDVRGVFGTSLTERDAFFIGRSFAAVLHRPESRRLSGRPRIAVGRDGRLSSPALEQALVEGLIASGVDVVRIGLASSPMLYFAETSAQDLEGGIQVTGSHNPKDHNGFKIVLGGAPFFADRLAELGDIASAGVFPDGAGAVIPRDIGEAYIDHVLAALRGVDSAALARLRIGWDAGNGAAGPMLERLMGKLPGEHHLLYSEVDGRFPNHHPDPTIEANLADLRALVAAKRLDFGVAFDGDADRIGAVDAQGRVVWGDQLLAILARDLLQRLPGAGVIGDVKMSAVTFEAIADAGGAAMMWKSGHSHIKSRMKETGALLGGEMSGHMFFADTGHGYDDGVYAAVRLMAAIVRLRQSLAQLRDAMPETFSTPELRFPVDPARKMAAVREVGERLAASDADVLAIDGVRVTTPDGWWLLRASHTQDMLTARAESTSEQGLERLVAAIDGQLALSGLSRSA